MNIKVNTLIKGLILLFLSFNAFSKEKTFDIYDKNVLRVCSDSSNMPFSNSKLEGFENKIASLIAKEINVKKISYVWYPLGIGFIRNTLKANLCDLVLSTTLKNSLLLNTNPYYESSYVLVYRKNEGLNLKGLFDKNLEYLKIGLPNNTPPLSVLLRLRFDQQLHYYPLLTDNRHYSLNKKMINDLLNKKIDVAILWGPLVANYVKQHPDKLNLTVLANRKMRFKISMGVRNGETKFKQLINKVLRKNEQAIHNILKEYNVPLII